MKEKEYILHCASLPKSIVKLHKSKNWPSCATHKILTFYLFIYSFPQIIEHSRSLTSAISKQLLREWNIPKLNIECTWLKTSLYVEKEMHFSQKPNVHYFNAFMHIWSKPKIVLQAISLSLPHQCFYARC